MNERDHLFQRLCHEAVLACGSDVAAVERYVAARLQTLDPPERARIKRDIAQVLGFRAPSPGRPQ